MDDLKAIPPSTVEAPLNPNYRFRPLWYMLSAYKVDTVEEPTRYPQGRPPIGFHTLTVGLQYEDLVQGAACVPRTREISWLINFLWVTFPFSILPLLLLAKHRHIRRTR
ncbi:hypothetical protein AFLA_013438 [Aspergillus flavus NRRL3357]|nr:hypothetical protein AFLA_013438 [Aspergillus flavus NRRL3357]